MIFLGGFKNGRNHLRTRVECDGRHPRRGGGDATAPASSRVFRGRPVGGLRRLGVHGGEYRRAHLRHGRFDRGGI